MEFKKDRRTNYVSFNLQCTQYRRTIEWRQTDKLFFAPYIGIYARQWKFRFISSFILKSAPDKRTTFNFTPHIVVLDRQADKLRFVSPLYWDQSMTDGWIFKTPHIVIYVIEGMTNELHFVSSSCWNQRLTDKPFFIHQFGFHVRHTDKLRLISFLIYEYKQDRRRNYVSFTSYIGIQGRGTNYVSFHSSYWDPSKTDRQTQLHFTPQNGIHMRQTDKLSFILPLVLESK